MVASLKYRMIKLDRGGNGGKWLWARRGRKEMKNMRKNEEMEPAVFFFFMQKRLGIDPQAAIDPRLNFWQFLPFSPICSSLASRDRF